MVLVNADARSIGFPEAGVACGWESSIVGGSGPPQEQHVFRTMEPLLQPLFFVFYLICLFTSFIYLCVLVWSHTVVHMPQHTCAGQRTTFRN